MSKPVRVYNKGKRPIVWQRTFRGTEVIHPNKFDLFSKEIAEGIIKKFDDACSEKDFKEIEDKRKAEAKKATEDQEKARKVKLTKAEEK